MLSELESLWANIELKEILMFVDNIVVQTSLLSMWLYNIYLRLVNMDIIEVQLDYADGEDTEEDDEGKEEEEEEVECKELGKDEKKNITKKGNILNTKVISQRYLLLFLVFGIAKVVKIMLAISK